MIHANDIKHTDTSKISFKGIYLYSYYFQEKSVHSRVYTFYRFFPNGKVYSSPTFYDKKPTKSEIEDFTKGTWWVYYTRENNVYIEQYNGYNGYYLRSGHWGNNHEILFTDKMNSLGKIQKDITAIYALELTAD